MKPFYHSSCTSSQKLSSGFHEILLFLSQEKNLLLQQTITKISNFIFGSMISILVLLYKIGLLSEINIFEIISNHLCNYLNFNAPVLEVFHKSLGYRLSKFYNCKILIIKCNYIIFRTFMYRKSIIHPIRIPFIFATQFSSVIEN